MADKPTYTFKGLDDQSIIKTIIQGSALSSCSINEYTREQLLQFASLAINVIRGFIARNAGISEVDLQEWLDTMCFKAQKDSRTSSMRPSSDMYRSTSSKDDEALNSEEDQSSLPDYPEDSNKTSSDEASHVSGQSAQESETETEQDAEKKLRRDHNRSLRKKSGKKPGGQEVHSGT